MGSTERDTVIDDNEDDPIQASYDVYIKPQWEDGRQLYILQFPNRPSKEDYSSTNASLPIELRLKPKAGLVELDVPLDPWTNYDRTKGVQWGEAMRKSNASKSNTGTAGGQGGSHGLAGGFGIGGVAPGPGRGRQVQEDTLAIQQEILDDFAAGITRQRVLTKQTLGGQVVPKESASPNYFIGAFRKGQLHLSPVNEIVQMRPQFHHIDATAELERLARPRAEAGPAGAGARAIHMTVKTTGEGEEDGQDSMAERIKNAQEEKWQKMRYIDDNSDAAWETFEELFAQDTENLPKLESGIDDATYLDTISAPRDEARLSRAKLVENE
ncbi:hypothetical protein V495_05552 [Pseudogymnoascus sp. VKM F-4514 (FW-929)]|nr:hypothetical protein V490_02934 [Pseudogymnoascus sp. VKM F-3557]KFY40217.1 hypothetical protein V495_05552 [Pseudogymnoascus sp. VKM F-4514 (FW-929)]KFY68097.1 hypothetical protein V497_00037 [Pseudogymnoascus sp. VKM F-4516 (FW-969)]